MKIIQINAWLGRLNGPLARFIEEEKPDIVCMQEAFGPGLAHISVFHDQYEFVSEVMKAGSFNHHFFAPAWGFEMVGEIVDVGNIILSKLPILDTVAHHTFNAYHVRKKAEDMLPNTRVWQACQVRLPDSGKLSVANYQGYVDGNNPSGNQNTVLTMECVRNHLIKLPRPLIFCGDFNVNPNSPAMKLLDDLDLINLTASHKIKTTLSSAHRAPLKDRQSVAVDYILASPEIEVKNFEVSEELVSDHKALVLEFEL